MATLSIWHLIIPLVVVFAGMQIHRTRDDARCVSRRQDNELQPVFSAETHRGTEAEFTDERLPRMVPLWLIALVVATALTAYLWTG